MFILWKDLVLSWFSFPWEISIVHPTSPIWNWNPFYWEKSIYDFSSFFYRKKKRRKSTRIWGGLKLWRALSKLGDANLEGFLETLGHFSLVFSHVLESEKPGKEEIGREGVWSVKWCMKSNWRFHALCLPLYIVNLTWMWALFGVLSIERERFVNRLGVEGAKQLGWVRYWPNQAGPILHAGKPKRKLDPNDIVIYRPELEPSRISNLNAV